MSESESVECEHCGADVALADVRLLVAVHPAPVDADALCQECQAHEPAHRLYNPDELDLADYLADRERRGEHR